ncbi:MAG: hypothetical protein KAR00_03070 [Candidatus Pacebacteria bacterium]|nr:hypothetical protein [Candidatus Paceibacterota bacterium]
MRRKVKVFVFLMINESARERYEKIQDEREMPDFTITDHIPLVGELITRRGNLCFFPREGRWIQPDKRNGELLITSKVYKVTRNTSSPSRIPISVYAFIKDVEKKVKEKTLRNIPTL